MTEFISQPWPWYVAGPAIAVIMFLLYWFGESFGISSSFRAVCSAMGAGNHCDFFRFDWKSQVWNLLFIAGTMLGGLISSLYLTRPDPINLAPETLEDLQELGIENAGENYLPEEVFNWENLLTPEGFVLMVIGGFLIGFGTRWAGGCTSGHAISGLSNLQLPSLIAVIGFFIGGLFTTHVLLPLIFS